MNSIFNTPIKSYMLRQRKATPKQLLVCQEAWAYYGLNLESGMINFQHTFGRLAPCTLEIGFGNGSSLLEQAKTSTQTDFIGVEVYSPGIHHLVLKAQQCHLTNLRIFQNDAIEVMKSVIPNHSLDCIQIFFPDPWPKRRHHKRRLIQRDFAILATSKIKRGGRIHCATDWTVYAEHMMEIFSNIPQLSNLAGYKNYYPEAYKQRPITKFEKKGLKASHNIWDLVFEKNNR